MDEIRVMGVGMVGAGFSRQAFDYGLAMNPHVVASDAGTADFGPYPLGSGTFLKGKAGVKSDLEVMLTQCIKNNLPLIIGSVGGAGGAPQLAETRKIVEEIAQAHGLHFRAAFINAEQNKEYLKELVAKGRSRPYGAMPPLTAETIDSSVRIVGMMGVEPFVSALDQGAQVVVAGRCTDPSIFAAYPLHIGTIPKDIVWHAARLVDKGPLITTTVSKHACSFGYIRKDHFVVTATRPDVEVTTTTAAALMQYENPHPARVIQPSGTIDSSGCTFEQIDSKTVRVTGSRFEPAERYSIKLEGARQVGYGAAAIVGIRDPRLIANLDGFLEKLQDVVRRNVKLLGISPEQYKLRFRRYGIDGVMGAIEPLAGKREPIEVGLLVDSVADTEDLALTVVGRVCQVGTTMEFPGRQCTAGNFAVPFAPAPMRRGPVFEWSVWHLVEPDRPEEMFPVEIVDL